MAEKKKEPRRLPVLSSSSEPEETDDRPAWHWSAIGIVAIFIGWFALSQIVVAAFGSVLPSTPGGDVSLRVRIGLPALAAAPFGLACFGGGYLIGRFAAKAGRREASVAGAGAAFISWALALQGGAPGGWLTWALLLPLLAGLGVFGARFGAGIGRKHR